MPAMCSLAEFVSKNEISHASSKSISWDAISKFSWHVISVPSLLQILKHYSKPGVEAKEVLPLFPDFKVIISSFPFSQNLPSPIPLSFLLPLLLLPSLPPPPPLSLSLSLHLQLWHLPFAQVIFDTDPAVYGKKEDQQIQEMSQAMIRL